MYVGPVHCDPVAEALASVLPAASRVLDLGCGSGRNSLFLAGSGHAVTAVDRDLDALRQADEFSVAHATEPLNHQTVHADIRYLRPTPGAYDAVLCTYVLHELSRAEQRMVLRYMRDATSPGGWNLVVAYTGTNTDRAVYSYRNLVPEGEIKRTFENAGWTTTRHYQLAQPVTALRGRPFFVSRCIVLVRKPLEASVSAGAPLAALQKSDPEYFDDVVQFGLAVPLSG